MNTLAVIGLAVSLTVCQDASPPDVAATEQALIDAIETTAEVERAHGASMHEDGIYVLLDGPLPRDGVEGELALLEALREAGVFDATAAYARIADSVAHTRPDEWILEVGGGSLVSSDARRLLAVQLARMRIAAVDEDVDGVVQIADEVLAHAQGASARLGSDDRTIAAAMQISVMREVSSLIQESLLDEATCSRLTGVIDARSLSDLGAHLRATQETMCEPDYLDWVGTEASEGDLEALLAEVLAHLETPVVALPEYDDDEFSQLSFIRYMHFMAVELNATRAMFVKSAKIMLALEIYKRRHGAYPAVLDDLVPDVIEELPADPISGRGFGYRALPERDAQGRAYLLYSIGYDGEDNGGREGDQTAQLHVRRGEPEGHGHDWVINEARDPVPEDAPR